MYVSVPLLIGFGRSRNRFMISLSVLTTSALVIYFIRIAPGEWNPVFYGSSLVSLLEVAPYFQIGAIYAVFGLTGTDRPIALATLLLGMDSIVTNHLFGEICLMIVLPAFVVTFGNLHFPAWGRLSGRNDVSYGLYLYAFPVQQSISAIVGCRYGPFENTLVTLPVTFLLASASWHLIEKRLLWSKTFEIKHIKSSAPLE
jgi:peptidoglycan/LPS O-acetylase OafA/YrhL